MPHIDISLINCFYFFLLLLGVFYAVMVMIAGGLHAIHLPALHADLGGLHLPGVAHVDVSGAAGHDISLISLSPISIAAFVTSFGGIGIIATQGFGADSATSLVWAIGGSIVVAVVSHFIFFYVFIAPQASSALKTSDIVGQNAEVTVPIPANSVGEVAYVAMGERHTATARSADNKEIPRGALVSIEALAGTMLIVRLK
jgi:membrane protein implicated in regulation of membrane protease activity